jgi:hypothetical protein
MQEILNQLIPDTELQSLSQAIDALLKTVTDGKPASDPTPVLQQVKTFLAKGATVKAKLAAEDRLQQAKHTKLVESLTQHRLLIQKIAQMTTTSGGRNAEAALAAKSFLDTNPAE